MRNMELSQPLLSIQAASEYVRTFPELVCPICARIAWRHHMTPRSSTTVKHFRGGLRQPRKAKGAWSCAWPLSFSCRGAPRAHIDRMAQSGAGRGCSQDMDMDLHQAPLKHINHQNDLHVWPDFLNAHLAYLASTGGYGLRMAEVFMALTSGAQEVAGNPMGIMPDLTIVLAASINLPSHSDETGLQ